MKTLCIIGLGYIGLPTASMFATHGYQVMGVDKNEKVIESLQQGKIHIFEPGLQKVVTAGIESGMLKVSSQVEPADAFIIAVPTPFLDEEMTTDSPYKKADMRFVVSAAQAIVPHLRKGNLVVLESTSPPLTTANQVRPILEKSGLKAGQDFFLAYSPERVLPGQILQELVDNSRVIGGINPESAEMGRDLYSAFVQGEIVMTDATTAEMVKLMENTYRDVNIAIANEFSRLADRFEINVWEAIEIANRHPRVNILNPGPGVGGHCISVDPWFLVEAAPDITPFIYNARMVNDSQPDFVVKLVERFLGDLHGKTIAILGLAYKPNVDDFRESPAIEVVHNLMHAGCNVRAHDPYATSFHQIGAYMVNTLEEAVKDADLLILLVDHNEFKSLAPEACKGMQQMNVLDTRHCLNVKQWKQAGFKILNLGDTKNK